MSPLLFVIWMDCLLRCCGYKGDHYNRLEVTSLLIAEDVIFLAAFSCLHQLTLIHCRVWRTPFVCILTIFFNHQCILLHLLKSVLSYNFWQQNGHLNVLLCCKTSTGESAYTESRDLSFTTLWRLKLSASSWAMQKLNFPSLCSAYFTMQLA